MTLPITTQLEIAVQAAEMNRDENARLAAEVKRLRTALQFYAIRYNGDPEHDDATATICNDHGSTARKALGKQP
jgi:hypothetical protein